MMNTKEVGVVKRIDELGRIVIPIEIRRFLNITDFTDLSILATDGKIVIEKISTNCICCSKTVEERGQKDYNFIDNICNDCIAKIINYNNTFIENDNKI